MKQRMLRNVMLCARLSLTNQSRLCGRRLQPWRRAWARIFAKNWCDECFELQDFPKGQLDESKQPLDLSAQNSWSHG